MAAIPTNANEFIEQQLDLRLSAVEEAFDADAITIVSELVFGVDDFIRSTVEDLRQRDSKRSRLVVILTTGGGYIETVQRIVETLRHHYGYVIFIVPNYAYSAGTVLVMSGNEIWMDYYSRLGPIDPQVQTTKGTLVPALGYLKQYDRLVEKANAGKLTQAEAVVMLNGFDQAELYQYAQARDLSIRFLEEWLCKYKFKDWTETATRRLLVTEEMRQERAKHIATELNNTDRWKSHGYGISREVVINELSLIIDDLDGNPDRREKVKQYSGLLVDYMGKQEIVSLIHATGKYQPFSTGSA